MTDTDIYDVSGANGADILIEIEPTQPNEVRYFPRAILRFTEVALVPSFKPGPSGTVAQILIPGTLVSQLTSPNPNPDGTVVQLHTQHILPHGVPVQHWGWVYSIRPAFGAIGKLTGGDWARVAVPFGTDKFVDDVFNIDFVA